MASKQADDQYSEREASRRFAATVKRTLEMPPQPHQAKGKRRHNSKTTAARKDRP